MTKSMTVMKVLLMFAHKTQDIFTIPPGCTQTHTLRSKQPNNRLLTVHICFAEDVLKQK